MEEQVQDNLSNLLAYLENETEGAQYSKALKPFQKAGRWIPIAVGPFINIDMAIYVGAHKVNRTEPPPSMEEEDIKNLKLISKICPDLKTVLRGCSNNTDLLKHFIAHLSAAASNSRSDDTSSCRKAAASFIIFSNRVNPAEVDIEQKSKRGWNNRYTARLLCPLKRLSEFDRDPELFMGKVLGGTIKLTASQLPSFLYPPNAVYSPHQQIHKLIAHFLALFGLQKFDVELSCIFSSPTSIFTTQDSLETHDA